jgi:hypothetical protein
VDDTAAFSVGLRIMPTLELDINRPLATATATAQQFDDLRALGADARLMRNEDTIAAEIVRVLHAFPLDAWRQLNFLAVAGLLAQLPPQRAKLLAAGALDATLAGLRAHAADANVQMNGCTALGFLLEGSPLDDDAHAVARRGGALELVLLALSAHRANARVVKDALLALASLSASPATCVAACESGALEAVRDAMLQHASDASLQRFACMATCTLADNDGTCLERARAAGLMEAVTAVLSLPSLAPTVALRVCSALSALAGREKDHQVAELCGGADAVAALVAVLRAYPDEHEVSSLACSALLNFSNMPPLASQMCALGAFDAALALSTPPGELRLLLLGSIATDGDAKTVAAGRLLGMLLHALRGNADIVVGACKSLMKLSSHYSPDYMNAAIDLGVVDALLALLRARDSSANVLRWVVAALCRTLVCGPPAAAHKAAMAGAARLVAAAEQRFEGQAYFLDFAKQLQRILQTSGQAAATQADAAAAALLAEEEAERTADAAAKAKKKHKKKGRGAGAAPDAEPAAAESGGPSDAIAPAEPPAPSAAGGVAEAAAPLQEEAAAAPPQASAAAARHRRRAATKAAQRQRKAAAHSSAAASHAAHGDAAGGDDSDASTDALPPTADDAPPADAGAADVDAAALADVPGADADAPPRASAALLEELFPWMRMTEPRADAAAPPPLPPPAPPAPPMPPPAPATVLPPFVPPPAAAAVAAAAPAAEPSDPLACVICLDAPRALLLLPCRHVPVCASAACAAMMGAPPLCPLCRVAVADTLAVFL